MPIQRDIMFDTGEYLKAETCNEIIEQILKCIRGKGLTLSAARTVLEEAEKQMVSEITI